jgi:hypothetical protein
MRASCALDVNPVHDSYYTFPTKKDCWQSRAKRDEKNDPRTGQLSRAFARRLGACRIILVEGRTKDRYRRPSSPDKRPSLKQDNKEVVVSHRTITHSYA